MDWIDNFSTRQSSIQFNPICTLQVQHKVFPRCPYAYFGSHRKVESAGIWLEGIPLCVTNISKSNVHPFSYWNKCCRLIPAKNIKMLSFETSKQLNNLNNAWIATPSPRFKGLAYYNCRIYYYYGINGISLIYEKRKL